MCWKSDRHVTGCECCGITDWSNHTIQRAEEGDQVVVAKGHQQKGELMHCKKKKKWYKLRVNNFERLNTFFA